MNCKKLKGDEYFECLFKQIEAKDKRIAELEAHTCENCVLGDYIYRDDEQYQQGKGCLLQYYAVGTIRWHNLKSCSEFQSKDTQCN